MSDGPSDMHRAMDEVRQIEACADRLADAIVACTDSAFGLSGSLLSVANHELKRAGYKLVRTI